MEGRKVKENEIEEGVWRKHFKELLGGIETEGGGERDGTGEGEKRRVKTYKIKKYRKW